MISSSSGASIPAAYYGIYGKEVFLRDFTEDVLYRQIQTALKWRTLNPWHWPRLLSGTFSRGDLFAEYFDETIYDGHTFADMPLQRPLILLNATVIGIGSLTETARRGSVHYGVGFAAACQLFLRDRQSYPQEHSGCAQWPQRILRAAKCLQ
jgi:hypothetical protein